MTITRNTKILLYILFAVVLLVAIIVCNIVRQNTQIGEVQVALRYDNNDALVSVATIEQMVARSMPTLRSQLVKEVNTEKIRSVVMSNPYIERCEVSVSVGCNVVIKAVQRTPVVHVFMSPLQRKSVSGDSAVVSTIPATEFYLDKEGKYMPISSEGTCNVLVGNGEFREPLSRNHSKFDAQKLAKSKKWSSAGIVQMWQLSRFLYDHPDYGELFDQVYLSPDGDLYLVPKVGDHVVLVGDAHQLNEKFQDLMVFYRNGMNRVGWNVYKQVSLKYKNQVICTKR